MKNLVVTSWFALLFLLPGCGGFNTNNYIETEQQAIAYFERVDSWADSINIKELPNDVYIEEVAILICDCISKTNLEILEVWATPEQIDAVKTGKDSIRFLAASTMIMGTNYILDYSLKNGYAYNDLQSKTLKDYTRPKCPDIFKLYEKRRENINSVMEEEVKSYIKESESGFDDIEDAFKKTN